MDSQTILPKPLATGLPQIVQRLLGAPVLLLNSYRKLGPHAFPTTELNGKLTCKFENLVLK